MDASLSLLLSQWSADKAPRLRALIGIWLTHVQAQHDLLARLALYRTIATAEGAFLDRIGGRLACPRPWVDASLLTDRWGFDEAGVGFDQDRFLGESALEPRIPAGDVLYRKFLRARGIAIRSGATLREVSAAARMVDPQCYVRDGRDLTVTITTQNKVEMDIAVEIGALPIPPGVRFTVQRGT